MVAFHFYRTSQGRMEMRPVQTAGAGCAAPVRISGGGEARAKEDRMGAGKGVGGGVSEIAGDAG